MNISKHFLCPSCRGSRIALGEPKLAGGLAVGDNLFRPMGKGMFLGFQVFPIACLDCGYVGTCLNEDQRSELEHEVREQ